MFGIFLTVGALRLETSWAQVNSVTEQIQIIAFYEFKDMPALRPLEETREMLKDAIRGSGVRGTIIIADEGFNGMVCGTRGAVSEFTGQTEAILATTLHPKSSFHEAAPFRKIDVKIKPEIVTLRRPVDISRGSGTHVKPDEWNALISDPETYVLDTRNHYEYETGTFTGAVDPGTTKFSELPEFVENNLDPERHKRIAMFCTGGIRCEKFAPYMKQLGFEEVYQLEGGILRYLEEVPEQESLWQGECFVFDERVTVDTSLSKGSMPDHSLRHANERAKVAE